MYRQTICLVLHVGETTKKKNKNSQESTMALKKKNKTGCWCHAQRKGSSLCPKWLKCH